MSSTPPARATSIRRNTWLFVVALSVLLAAMEGLSLFHQRAARLEQVKTETTNLARSFADHAQSAFHLADEIMLEFRDAAERDGFGVAQRTALAAQMRHRVQGLALLRFVFIADATGQVVASSAVLPPGGISIATRDYFTKLRDGPDRGLVLGTLDKSILDGSWTVRLARRLDKPDGSFAGAVVGTIDLGFFQTYYRKFDVGADGTILLLTNDGRVMAREPFVDAQIGQTQADTPLIRTHLPRAPFGTLEQDAGGPDMTLLLSYRRIDDFPLVVTVARSRRESLARWRWEASTHFAGLAVILFVVGAFAHRLTEQIRERERIERERERLAAAYQLLADNATDLIVRLAPDLHCLYASPACLQLIGYNPEELLGHTLRFFIHGDDWPAAERFLRCLTESDGPPSAKLDLRAIHRDGATLWIEAHGKRVNADDGLLVTLHDISPRKAAEARLEEMARTDELTGLTNRRGFDLRLGQEFRRARRVPACVALVMIDVDRFKVFNDTYGHQEGDRCLRAVARALAGSARRPGDVAARYGGEEMALILPDTDVAGALVVAERARSVVAALEIPHAGSPFGIVTISLGVAAVFTGCDETSMDDLVKAADAALYAAKTDGRNTVRLAAGRFRRRLAEETVSA